MLGFLHHQWVFQPPPCICEEVEARVREAIAMRDEMATWMTPLAEWQQLQQMPVLRLTTETSLRIGPPLPPPLYETFESSPQAYLRLQPGESFEVGTVLVRPFGRFKIVERLFDNTNRVVVRKL